jgi:tRNA threonylcarbamoyl adenosine modification protein YeaZ
MSFLLIDASSIKSFIALINREGIVWLSFFEDQKSSTFFALEIERRFPKGLEGVDAIAVGLGPGAFTGVRAGLSLALGLSQGSGLPLKGFSALSGFVSKKEGVFASVIDARIGGVYAQKQRRVGERIECLEEPHFVPLDQFNHFFENCNEVVGPDLSRLTFPVPVVEERPDMLHLYHTVSEHPTHDLNPIYLTSPVVSP